MQCNAQTKFEELQEKFSSLPMIAARMVFFDGKEKMQESELLPEGVSDANILWMKMEIPSDDAITMQRMYAALGMAFLRYDNNVRLCLLTNLPMFDPFVFVPAEGMLPHETEDSLFAVAIHRPVGYMMYWGKFRTVGCLCLSEDEKVCCSAGRGDGNERHPQTKIALSVLRRLRSLFPDRAATMDMVSKSKIF